MAVSVALRLECSISDRCPSAHGACSSATRPYPATDTRTVPRSTMNSSSPYSPSRHMFCPGSSCRSVARRAMRSLARGGMRAMRSIGDSSTATSAACEAVRSSGGTRSTAMACFARHAAVGVSLPVVAASASASAAATSAASASVPCSEMRRRRCGSATDFQWLGLPLGPASSSSSGPAASASCAGEGVAAASSCCADAARMLRRRSSTLPMVPSTEDGSTPERRRRSASSCSRTLRCCMRCACAIMAASCSSFARNTAW